MSAQPDLLKCVRCGDLKPADQFAWRRRERGQHDSFCRPCRAAYGKEHYAANKDLYVERARQQKRRLMLERTRFLLDYFKAHPCTDCGETDPVVLEFDHLRDKRFAIGAHLARRSWASILEELAKCEVVCANCHRRRTSTRRGSVRALLTQT